LGSRAQGRGDTPTTVSDAVATATGIADFAITVAIPTATHPEGKG